MKVARKWGHSPGAAGPSPEHGPSYSTTTDPPPGINYLNPTTCVHCCHTWFGRKGKLPVILLRMDPLRGVSAEVAGPLSSTTPAGTPPASAGASPPPSPAPVAAAPAAPGRSYSSPARAPPEPLRSPQAATGSDTGKGCIPMLGETGAEQWTIQRAK